MTQTTLDSPSEPPATLDSLRDELFWIRKELQELTNTNYESMVELTNQLYDNNVLLGLLQAAVKDWVEVAEE